MCKLKLGKVTAFVKGTLTRYGVSVPFTTALFSHQFRLPRVKPGARVLTRYGVSVPFTTSYAYFFRFFLFAELGRRGRRRLLWDVQYILGGCAHEGGHSGGHLGLHCGGNPGLLLGRGVCGGL